MDGDMQELMGKLNDMLNSDSSNDLKNLINNLKSTDSSSSSSTETNSTNSDNDFNMDFETIMKIKKIMDAFNSKKDDPRATLLKSLKPYLKESRKDKLDQYVQLLNMSSVFELFKNTGGDSDGKTKQ